MTSTILMLTARHLLGRRRVIFMALLACVPVLVAVVFRIAGGGDEDPDEFTVSILEGLVLPVVLPLVALVFGTAALGAEIEDGTIVYLLAKPIDRARIFMAKVLVSALATAALVVPLAVLAALIVLGADDGDQITIGFAVGLVVGSFAYCAVFVALSAFTSRALIAGMIYVFVWEGLVTGLFSGTRIVSIRAYVTGIADMISSAPDRVLEADLGSGTAIVAMVLVTVVATFLGIRLLQRFEIGERV